MRWPRDHAARPTNRLALVTSAGTFDEWTRGEIVRDLKDFAGSFSFSLREPIRVIESLEWASLPPVFRLSRGMEARILVDGELVLVGHIETIDRSIDADRAEITVSGRDKSADLVDAAAAPDGPGEFANVRLEEAARRICEPFGLKVRCEVDTKAPFARYSMDLAETGLSAIEKGARQRQALVTSDGVGGVVITRTGSSRAPADLTLPGNVKSSRLSSSDQERFSETIVRGQGEKAAGTRAGRKAALDTTAEPLSASARSAPAGGATDRERAGTAITGRSRDPEIARHRPVVHLARSQPDSTSAQSEADWRMRTARGAAEELVVVVHDFRAAGQLWRVNQLARVSDVFQDIDRDLLISRTATTYDEDGSQTEMTLISPEAFDPEPVGRRRENKPASERSRAARSADAKTSKSKGPLDGTAGAL